MTATETINAALKARNMTPIDPVCPCCNDTWEREAFPDKSEYTIGPDLVDRFGSMPCHECTDSFHSCDYCGGATRQGDDDYSYDGGNHYCSFKCEYGDGPDSGPRSTYSVNDALHHA